MERDDFECVLCCEKEKTLNVHHIYYERNKMPWEYPDEIFITLCDECHDMEHTAKNLINSMDLEAKFRRFGVPSFVLYSVILSLEVIKNKKISNYHKKLIGFARQLKEMKK